jgi:RNA polymerase sigma-70 factor, ECF subfamily
MTEASLLARAAAGDRESYAALVSQHYPVCLRVARGMLRDPADAEDAVQDAFLRALRSLGRRDERVPFRAWLFRILINRCRSVGLERSRRERRFVLDDSAVDRAVAPDGPVPGNAVAIMDALQRIDLLLREAFLLKYVEELEYKEMSAMTGVGVSALKMRVKRACEALRPFLEGIYRER